MSTWPTSIGRFIKFRLWGVTAMDIFSIQIYCKPISYCLYWFVQSQNVESSNSLLPDPKVGNWFGFKLPWCLHLRSAHQLEPSKQKIQNDSSHFWPDLDIMWVVSHLTVCSNSRVKLLMDKLTWEITTFFLGLDEIMISCENQNEKFWFKNSIVGECMSLKESWCCIDLAWDGRDSFEVV